jgi:formate hydrogenlyase transcriptional activator
VFPLAAGERVVGVLAIARHEEGAFSSDAIGFLAHLGKQIAVAVEYSEVVAGIAGIKGRTGIDDLRTDEDPGHQPDFGRIVGTSPALRRALKQIETVSPTDSTIIIQGETGTGKDLLARAIHDLSQRRSGPLVRLNCAALPAGLLESELFGHEKGAFTSACAQRIGRFELAHGGTVFLDEVGEIPLELQPKLLRVLQEREFERLGGTRTLRTDTRVIAATNRDRKSMVDRGTFRPDLYYRLNVFPIHVPALRDRPEDIPLLVRHFANEFARRMSKSIDSIPSSTMSQLRRYPWPGNIRELQNVVERAVILSRGPVLEVDTAQLKLHDPPRRMTDAKVQALPLKNVRDALQQAQRDEILRALRDAGGRVGGLDGAAARLGLKRTTLIARMKKLGIDSRPRSAA